MAFGNLGVMGGKVTVQGWLFDVKNTGTPQVLGKQYSDNGTEEAARTNLALPMSPVLTRAQADEVVAALGALAPA